jgi:amidase
LYDVWYNVHMEVAMELWEHGAATLAQMVAAREVSVVEIVKTHLQRIEEVNPHVNAIVCVLADDALGAARRADRLACTGGELGPLHGVPFTVKENIDLAGTPTTEGVRAFADAVAPSDAPIVERLRRAGAIPIGRTNVPDLALRMHTDSSLHGQTRNPWDPRFTAGGSSGGDAVALATGMTPLGTGNDIGGSLRAPAHCCGIASIKPSFGRVAHARSVGAPDGSLAEQLMQVPGVMGRTVTDVRLALEVVAGRDARDPDSVAVPLDVDREPTATVAVVADPPGGETHPGIAAAVRTAAAALQAAGYTVTEVTPPGYEQALELWSRWLSTELRAMLPQLEQVMGADGLRFLTLLLERLPTLDLDEYVATLAARRTVARVWADFLRDYPLVLSPVWTGPPFPTGFDIVDGDAASAVLSLVRPVLPANLLGLPAAVVAAGRVEGLPSGVQIMGERFAEMRCLDAAEAVEKALGVETPLDPIAA